MIKLVSFFILLFCFSLAPAQIIDLKKPLFDEMGFFNRDEVLKNSIKSIRISRSDKKDGKIFQDEMDFLHYDFLSDGNILRSNKYIAIGDRYDTSEYIFSYDKEGNVYKRIEQQGPFAFEYYFMRKDGDVVKEIKIDGNSSGLDTAYIRYFEHSTLPYRKTTTVFNGAGKPFQTIFREWDSENRLLSEELRFVRNSNYFAINYKHQLEYLLEKSEDSYIGKPINKNWTFEYKDGLVDLILLTENGNELKKYAFLYGKNKLPSAIVERSAEDKTVIIYKISYEFLD